MALSCSKRRYMVFDCLEEGGINIENKPFETRLEAIKRICATVDQKDAALILGVDIVAVALPKKAVPMEKCANRDSLATALADASWLEEIWRRVEKRGGEGLMLRCPGRRERMGDRGSKYEHRRSKTLLKEAIVVGHAGGTGRVAGMCGALLCETPDKRRFKARGKGYHRPWVVEALGKWLGDG
eukprot:Skav216056  [mRNA]  locus=scaffold2261:47400:49990:- [translate_table: standard]